MAVDIVLEVVFICELISSKVCFKRTRQAMRRGLQIDCTQPTIFTANIWARVDSLKK